jgi:cytochrome c-type biogenesis protein CcmH/NrfG
VTEQSGHLSSAQIENYGIRTSGAGPETDQPDEEPRVEAHLAGCPSCRNRLLDFHRSHFALLATSADSSSVESKQPEDPQVRTASTPECPSEDALRQLAAGLFPGFSTGKSAGLSSDLSADLSTDALAAKLIQHAATCDHCGPLLRTFTEDFSDDFSPQEQAVLTDLQSSSPAWQKQTSRQMLQASGVQASGVQASGVQASGVQAASMSTAETSVARTNHAGTSPAGRSAACIAASETAATAKTDNKTDNKPDKKPSAERPASSSLGRKPFFWKWALIPATAAVFAVAAFSIWYTQRDTPEKVEKLLAQAYTEQRTMEMRWPGAEYGPIREPRGSENSRFSRPEALAQASKILATRNPTSSDRAAWLRARAELEMLQGSNEQAIPILSQALEIRSDSIPVLLDSANAYFQRGMHSDSRADIDQSIEILEKIIKKHPGNREAVFNLGTAYMAAKSWNRAAATWIRYLQLDSEGQWAAEARQKLASANLHIKQ